MRSLTSTEWAAFWRLRRRHLLLQARGYCIALRADLLGASSVAEAQECLFHHGDLIASYREHAANALRLARESDSRAAELLAMGAHRRGT